MISCIGLQPLATRQLYHPTWTNQRYTLSSTNPVTGVPQHLLSVRASATDLSVDHPYHRFASQRSSKNRSFLAPSLCGRGDIIGRDGEGGAVDFGPFVDHFDPQYLSPTCPQAMTEMVRSPTLTMTLLAYDRALPLKVGAFVAWTFKGYGSPLNPSTSCLLPLSIGQREKATSFIFKRPSNSPLRSAAQPPNNFEDVGCQGCGGQDWPKLGELWQSVHYEVG